MPCSGPQFPHWYSDTTNSSLIVQGTNCKAMSAPGERVTVIHLFLHRALDLSVHKLYVHCPLSQHFPKHGTHVTSGT